MSELQRVAEWERWAISRPAQVAISGRVDTGDPEVDMYGRRVEFSPGWMWRRSSGVEREEHEANLSPRGFGFVFFVCRHRKNAGAGNDDSLAAGESSQGSCGGVVRDGFKTPKLATTIRSGEASSLEAESASY